jgi:Tol biopolymer transport system component/DNA-binding winged helix-turn-helix (wHTH) protein
MAESYLQQTYRFQDFELDVPAYGLRHLGRTVRLERQPMDLLILLVERRHQLVSRSDIVDRLWGKDVFVDVETGINTAIRKIRHVLSDSAEAPVFVETVSGKGYRFIAPVEVVAGKRDALPAAYASIPAAPPASITPTASSLAPPPGLAGWRRPLIVVGATGLAVVALAGAWVLRSPRTSPAPPMHVVPITVLSGFEAGDLSPDGRQVAFDWEGEGPSNRDIYLKLVGSSELRRLTTDSAVEVAAVWSPDGRQIAYARLEPRPFVSWRIRVMSSLGGSDRQVSDFPVWVPATWSPDSRYLVAGRASPPDATDPSNGLYLIPVQGGEPRAITRPKAPEVQTFAKFSPDGHQLAYVSCDGTLIRTDCDVDVLDVDAAFAAAGAPRRLTRRRREWAVSLRPPAFPTGVMGLTWSRDGKSIIYSAEDLGPTYLWRVGVDGEHPPERIEVAGIGAIFPGIASAADRLMFSRRIDDEDIYRLETGRPAQPVARSSVFDSNPQFSPDGRRIVFCSLRSGDALEVWVADADGSRPKQLTHGPGRWQCGATWSPDGHQIAFDSQAADGSRHIWIVDSDGGTPQQITKDGGDQVMPTWSRDGEWIYFSWKRVDEHDVWRRDIWRTHRGTGSKERITHGGGVVGFESVDGRTLLYQPKVPTSALLEQSLAGGAPRSLIPCVIGTAVAVSQAGIYYVPCPDAGGDPDPPVRVMNPAVGTDREVGRLERYQYNNLPSGFAVSPDGRTILYSREVSSGADLMMIENYR